MEDFFLPFLNHSCFLFSSSVTKYSYSVEVWYVTLFLQPSYTFNVKNNNFVT
ncbi:hypothetical protein QW060_10945 [Myroides ceti]|uniref:Uncharacterized protein n=1 Tax=Paenimyroides ceti TaxID=395087 RepID=A0ABT8CTX9_9FLAO|nr:hypothetical protein [Paenimyroides ceti]MDN3707639.1 hypothetical protein [Paenimyroides ceti]